MAVMKDLVNSLKLIGIVPGDLVYVASDITLPLAEAVKQGKIRTLAQRDEYLGDIVDTLQTAVSSEGTLLFPVFTWGFCRGEEFDIRKTIGAVGVFNNWVMENRPEFKRTKHPIYSFMVWGKDTELLINMENKSSWGGDSPFAYLHEQDGKMLLFSVSLERGFTFMHYVEESIHVPYRYMKDFEGIYVDNDGRREDRTYSMYVRDLSIQSQGYMPDAWFDEAGVTKIARWGSAVLRSVDLASSYEVVKQDLLKDKGKYSYKFGNYELDWHSGPTHPSESKIFPYNGQQII